MRIIVHSCIFLSLFRYGYYRKWKEIFNREMKISNYFLKKTIRNQLAPLDCILDSNFIELTLMLPAFSASFSTIVSIINLRSPKIEAIWIRFHRSGDNNDEFMEAPPSKLTRQLRFHLNCLTALTLENQDTPVPLDLSIIGKGTPALIYLWIAGFRCIELSKLETCSKIFSLTILSCLINSYDVPTSNLLKNSVKEVPTFFEILSD